MSAMTLDSRICMALGVTPEVWAQQKQRLADDGLVGPFEGWRPIEDATAAAFLPNPDDPDQVKLVARALLPPDGWDATHATARVAKAAAMAAARRVLAAQRDALSAAATSDAEPRTSLSGNDVPTSR